VCGVIVRNDEKASGSDMEKLALKENFLLDDRRILF
jgi:hypothetical protein